MELLYPQSFDAVSSIRVGKKGREGPDRHHLGDARGSRALLPMNRLYAAHLSVEPGESMASPAARRAIERRSNELEFDARKIHREVIFFGGGH